MDGTRSPNLGLSFPRNTISRVGSELATGATPEHKSITSSVEPYPWILHPVIDLLFCCGGIFWAIALYVALTGSKVDLFGNSSAFWLAFISILGAHTFGDSHQPATLFRVYASKSTRDKLGLPVTIVGILALIVGILTLTYAPATTFFLKLIMAWGIQHGLAQCYGVALIYCYKRKYYLTQTEKKIMLAMVYATVVFMIVRMFAIKDFGSLKFNGYDVPFWGFLPDWAPPVALGILQLSILLFTGMVIRKYWKDKQIFPLPALLNLMTLILMSFLAPTTYVVLWFFFTTWWFHSCQYLVITSAFYFKERGLPENMPLSQIARMLWTKTSAAYFGLLFTVGFAVFYMFPMWMSEHGIPKAIAFATVYVAFNFHHYITDAFIWKLRDPQLQKLLVA